MIFLKHKKRIKDDPISATGRKKGLIVLSEDEEFETRPFDGRLMARLFSYLKPYRWQLPLIGFMSLTAIASALVLPYLLKIGIDRYIMRREIDGLGPLVLLYAGMAAVQYFALRLQGLVLVRLGQQAIFDLRRDLFEHVQKLSLSFFDRQKTGRIMIRITNDVNSLEEILTSGVGTAFADSFTLIGLIGMMFWLDWRLTMVISLTLPPTIWVAVFLRQRMLEVSRAMRRKLSAVNANLNESLLGIRVTQAFNRENVNAGLFREINDEHYQASMRFVPLNAFFWPWTGFLNTVGTSSVLLLGGVLSVYGWVTLGTIAAFMNYVNRFFQPIQNLSNLFNVVSTATASCERIFELMELVPEVQDPGEPESLGMLRGGIQFQNVDFGYSSEELILRDFNLEVRPGESIAIVGPTGAGKTTVINLLCRFYDPIHGRVVVDGHDLRSIRQSDFRRQIAVVLQDTFIFTGTIAENIRYGRPDAGRDEVMAAAKAVGVHDYIVTLPEGYDTRVQERGSSLSAGQRQLIAFARALLRDPRVLVLDEATSSIDTHTEHELQAALSEVLQGRTAFIIAHRLSTIKRADRIIVIHDGRIAEMGRHEDLVLQGGIYAGLYECQFETM